jgi:5-methylcytosine-specific restriction endonuclease McrA
MLQPSISLQESSAFTCTVSLITRKLIVANEKPLRKITTRRERLGRLISSSKQSPNEEDGESRGCRLCGNSTENLVLDSHSGSYVCTNCGTLDDTPIYQELHPFLWGVGSRSDCCEVWGSLSDSWGDTTYVRYFHFNEVLACITLTGPWIPNTDWRIIREYLQRTQDTRGGPVDKLAVQNVCKSINKDFGVKRFTQRYSEKWIQIKYRYDGTRPDFLNGQLIQDIRRDFRRIVRWWPQVKHLLVDRKNKTGRKQWPNYNETVHRIIKKRYRHLLPRSRQWVSRLSPKNRQPLKNFFKACFYLNGWE